MPISLISWLLANWKPVLILTSAVGLFGLGFYEGSSHVHRKWDAEKIEMERQAVRERDELQADANKKSAALEAQLAVERGLTQKLNRRLDDEVKNSVYHSCVVPASGLQIANESRTGNAAR